MKISNNGSALQMISQNTGKVTPLFKNSHKISQKISHNDQSNLHQASSSILNSQIFSQEQLFRKEQLFGALTQLEEAIKTFSQEDSAFEQHIKKVVAEIQKENSNLAKEMQKQAERSPEALLKMTQIFKKDLQIEIRNEQRILREYLVAAQNKNATEKKVVSQKDSQDLAQKLTTVTNNLHSNDSQTVAHLLF